MTKKVIHWIVLYHVVVFLRQQMTIDRDANRMKIVKSTLMIMHVIMGSVPEIESESRVRFWYNTSAQLIFETVLSDERVLVSI